MNRAFTQEVIRGPYDFESSESLVDTHISEMSEESDED